MAPGFVVPPVLSLVLTDIQNAFNGFCTNFNAAYSPDISAPTVASASQADVQTALNTLTDSINTSQTLSLVAPVLGTVDRAFVQSCCNGLARAVDQVVAPIVSVLQGLNVGGDVNNAVHDALAAHQAYLANLEMLLDIPLTPEEADAAREALLGRVEAAGAAI